jgi:xanthine dehydrogenase accessory factor
LKSKLPVWELLLNSIRSDTAAMLLYVLESKGSSPGRQGFYMAVNVSGDMAGSLGGGVMEHKFVEMAITKLKAEAGNKKVQIRKQIHDKVAKKDRSGMICSGEQTIFLYPVSQNDISPILAVIKSLKKDLNFTLTITPQQISVFPEMMDHPHEVEWISDNDFIYRERLGYFNHLYIIGGGHCALAFSELMQKMDFYIHIYEDREGLNTFEKNPFVQEKILVKDYSVLDSHIPDGNNCYIVIMTFGYRTDAIALRSLLNKKVKYFGVLGSKTKITKMFAELESEGLPADRLQKLHAPVGLYIKSQTPAEIAVSIAAEIIQIKNADS